MSDANIHPSTSSSLAGASCPLSPVPITRNKQNNQRSNKETEGGGQQHQAGCDSKSPREIPVWAKGLAPHQAEYPTITEARVKVMLRSLAKEDADKPKKTQKGAVKLHHLVYLVEHLWGGTPEDRAIMDLALIAFWSIARLGKLTYQQATGPPTGRAELKVRDVMMKPTKTGETKALIILWEAKTSKPGEEQMLRLLLQNHALCPVEAIKRRMKEAHGLKDTLFGFYCQDGMCYNLTKARVRKVLQGVWAQGNCLGISGHFF
ncbi:hypothetical protein PCANC_19236 [Puccinia coronata f. sp. avenae]|uniref:Uncharacterized protein n=1 Tax=Puccinia coronata f. sp. avenae TaxID=200324 RepID=A0A2N5UA02_9BASI|nr:hypothetical protein PCANC_19236 [Puccinia coronata f. sp. avenae]